MKLNYLCISLGAVVAMSAMSPAYAVGLPVYDLLNHTANASISISNALIYDEMLRTRKSLSNMGGDDTNYYTDIRNHWESNQFHDEANTEYNNNSWVYQVENNYHCNPSGGEIPIPSGMRAGDYNCIGGPGDTIIPIPTDAYGVGVFGTHATADQYMEESQSVLAGVGAHDSVRLRSIMEGNAVQAEAVDAQSRSLQEQASSLRRLAARSTSDMGQRMQAAYSNQLASAQTGEMMQMRALMLAEQNAQLLRAQESAAFDARQSVVESRLRAAPDLGTSAVASW